jgi:hypothetical protein
MARARRAVPYHAAAVDRSVEAIQPSRVVPGGAA